MFKRILTGLLIASLFFSPLLLASEYYTNQKPPLGSTIDWSNPITKGLVGAWIMNEGGGNIVNDIARSNNGKNIGANWVSTIKGTALNFNGSSYVDCGNKTSLQITRNFTIYALVNIPSTQSAYSRCINFFWPALGGSWELSFNDTGGGFVGNGKRPYVSYITSGPTFAARETNTDLIFGNSTSIIGVRNGGNLDIYTNGKIDNGASVFLNNNDIIYSTGKCLIGSFDGTSNYGNGKFGPIYVWNRALSPSEIQSLYVNPYQIIKYEPISLWKQAVNLYQYLGTELGRLEIGRAEVH